MYFGVHPTTCIPDTDKAGAPASPESVRSRKEIIAAVNCLYAEFDGKDFDSDDPRGRGLEQTHNHIHTLRMKPTALIASGGGYHAYWLLDEPWEMATSEDRSEAARLQAGWVKAMAGDEGAKDLARVLRLPGTVNAKYEDRPKVTMIEWHSDRLYRREDLAALVPTRASHPPVERDARPRMAEGRRAQEALQRLSPNRAQDYAKWVDVGFSLCELGDLGRELWINWSAQCKSKFDLAACEEKWPTFTPGEGRTLASLHYWAEEDSRLILRADALPPELKHVALLNHNDRYRTTWSRTRRDLDTSEQFDLSLAHHALENGWTDQEVADLLIAFRRKHGGGVEALLGSDYVERTIAKAKSSTPGGGARLLGIEVERVLQYGRDNPICTMVLEGGAKIPGLSMDDLTSYTKLRRVLFAMGVLVPRAARNRWQEVERYILSRVEVVSVPTRSENTLDWLANLAQVRDAPVIDDEDDPGEWLLRGIAIRHDGEVILRLTDENFENAQRRFGSNTRMKDIGARLRDLGFHDERIWMQPDGFLLRAPTRLRCWISEPGLFDEKMVEAFIHKSNPSSPPAEDTISEPSEERQEISSLLQARGAMSPSEIAHELNRSPTNVRKLCSLMRQDGQLHQPTHGVYALPTGSQGGPAIRVDFDAIRTRPENFPKWDGETLPDGVMPTGGPQPWTDEKV
ncbi:MAG: PriCT-2 domain-containing protein [Anaerolineae bacterium]